jgi:hypothetical protein
VSQLTDDLASIFADPVGKVPIVAGDGAFTTYGALSWEDVPENDATGYSVLTHKQQVVVLSQWVADAGIVQGTAVVVDGVDYTVRDVRHETHGAVTRLIIT